VLAGVPTDSAAEEIDHRPGHLGGRPDLGDTDRMGAGPCRRRGGTGGGGPAVARWVLIALVAGSSVLLLAQRDIHGTALTGGLLVGLTLATTTEQSRT
jgi:hypothetical protein